MISKTAIIFDNVRLGKNIIVEDYCIIGALFNNYNGEETIIGDNSIIRSHTVIYAGNKIGKNFHAGNKANIRELNIIGDNVSIGTMSVVEHHVVIEDNVRIHSSSFIPEFTIIKKSAWIGPNVVLTNAKYPLSTAAKNNLIGPIIYEKAKIGANVTILPGIKIGENALIGAGSVVVNDVGCNEIIAGNPGKVIGYVNY